MNKNTKRLMIISFTPEPKKEVINLINHYFSFLKSDRLVYTYNFLALS